MSDVPRLSQSIASILLRQSPFHAWHAHELLGGSRGDSTASMENGSLVHELALGGNKVVLCPFNDWRTNAAKEMRERIRDDGKVPMLQKHVDAARPAVKALEKQLADHGIVLDHYAREQRVQWEQWGIPCEGTPDAWAIVDGKLRILDLKTTAKPATMESVQARAASYWSIQLGAYTSAMATLHPEYAGRIEWMWLVLETAEPYGLMIAEPDATMRTLGERQWTRAVLQWGELLKSGYDKPWPGHGRRTIETPPWALAKEEYEDDAAE